MRFIPGSEDDDYDIDLGDGHWLKYYGWYPDRSIEANATRYAGVQDVDRCGAAVPHLKADGTLCGGFVTFDGETQRVVFPNHARWQVLSVDPLTLSPSLLCKACGDHGFIRDSKWVRA